LRFSIEVDAGTEAVWTCVVEDGPDCIGAAGTEGTTEVGFCDAPTIIGVGVGRGAAGLGAGRLFVITTLTGVGVGSIC